LWNEVLEQYRQPPAVVEDELKEGVPYRLRVVMKNGDGEQLSVSAESEVIKVSGRISLERKKETTKKALFFLGFNVPILTKTLRDALVPKKEEIKLEICAVGEPGRILFFIYRNQSHKSTFSVVAPLFVWFKDGEEIVPTPDNDNVSISNEGFVSKVSPSAFLSGGISMEFNHFVSP
jgi:hypothetical protein